MPTRFLIVDDEASNSRLYAGYLRASGEVETAEDAEEALRRMGAQEFDVLVTDLRMPAMDGIELARRVRDDHPTTEIVLVTGEADLDSAIDALRLGIVDYLRKPVERRDLQAAVDRSLERKRMLESLRRLQCEIDAPGGLGGMIGESAVMTRLKAAITRVQNTGTTVLVQGETGTGKELVARALHEGGYRAGGPFVAVNCAAVAPELLESELFGYEKGAFTGAAGNKAGLIEEADGGTFFLDEIGELPAELQAKMLRVLQERQVQRLGAVRPRDVDIRLVAATNRDLTEEVRAGRFREDLFFRLNVFPIRTPPLREHPEDVPLLARHFLATKAREYGLEARELDDALVEKLGSRPWPGNVRELQNLMERLLLIAEEPTCRVHDLRAAEEMEGGASAPAPPAPARPQAEAELPEGEDLPTLAEVELAYVKKVLDRCEGNKSAASKILGIHPATLNRKLAD